MRLLQQATAILALWSSSGAFAANLNIPMAFEYIAMDGKKISSSMFMHKSDLELSNGYHEIAIRYKDLVENDISDTKSEVKSTAFIVSLEVDGNHDYSLKPVGGETIRNPQEFAKSPDITIVRKDNGAVEFRVTHTDISKKSFSSRLHANNNSSQLQPGVASATSVVPTENIGRSTSRPVTMIDLTPSSTEVVNEGKNFSEAEKMLQHWWKKADVETRKEFLAWAIKQL